MASAAVCLAAAGAMTDAGARDRSPPEMRMAEAPLTTGSAGPRLRWGGPVPAAPRPGEVPVYVPSQSAYASPASRLPRLVPPESVPDEIAPPAAPDGMAEPAPDGWPAPNGPSEPDWQGRAEPSEPSDPGGQALPEEMEAAEDVPPAGGVESLKEPGYRPRQLYAPVEGEEPGLAAPAVDPVEDAGGEGALPPLDAPREVEAEESAFGYAATPRLDPWSGLKSVTPGATSKRRQVAPVRARSAYAVLEGRVPARRVARPKAGWFLERGRGALERETPTGYQSMPRSEAMCRKALAKLGVGFVDASSIKRSRSCGVEYPVKVTDIAPGIAMRPAATLNCSAALRVAQWMKDEVKPAARWKMLTRPTALLNASSYRCSRIAGSRSISEHASGSALDVRGFTFANGSTMEIEKKGFFSFREKGFQKKVRESACRYFGTVLGPGYNEAHADHLHLDTKERRRSVCK